MLINNIKNAIIRYYERDELVFMLNKNICKSYYKSSTLSHNNNARKILIHIT